MYFGYLVNEKVYIENSMKNCKWEGNYFLLNRKKCRRAFFFWLLLLVTLCGMWDLSSPITIGLLGKSPERAVLKKTF